jgi:CHAD domain-containing protein
MKKSTPNNSISSVIEPAAAGLRKYFDSRRETFGTALEAARLYYAVEGIHDLRVEIKRLRALYKMVEFIAPSFESKRSAAPLKDLFRSAGRLRDIDIQQAIVLPYLERLDLREYFNHLKQQELGLRKSFAGLAGPRYMKSLVVNEARISETLAVATPLHMQKQMRKRIRKLTGKLDRLIGQSHLKNDDLHATRKVSKELRYALDMWQHCYGRLPAAESTSERLKEAYNALGEWHDATLTMASVQRILKRHRESHLADPAAYRTFERRLRDRAGRHLAAFTRGSRRLRRSLTVLLAEFSRELSQPTTASRHRRVVKKRK